MGDIIDSKHNDSPKKTSEINSIPKGKKIDPRKMGLTGIRILVDKILTSIDGVGTPHLESLGITMSDLLEHRKEIETIFASIIRNDIRRPMRRQACAAAIRLGGHLKLTGLAPTLNNVLKAHHEEPSLRAAAADSLGLMRSKASMPVLVRHLKDPQPLVANAVITAIGKLGQSKILPTLKKLSKESKDVSKVKCLTMAINRIEKRKKLVKVSPKWKKRKITRDKKTNELMIEFNAHGQLVVK